MDPIVATLTIAPVVVGAYRTDPIAFHRAVDLELESMRRDIVKEAQRLNGVTFVPASEAWHA